MASGAAGYLTKPFRPRELRELAEQLVAQRPVSQEPHITGKSCC
jgi:DNA-binding response OmpR family regulator